MPSSSRIAASARSGSVAGTPWRWGCASRKQPDRAGKGQLQRRSQLVDQSDADLDQVLSGADQRAQPGRGRGVAGQVGVAVAVGAHRVGQQIGVEPVVLARPPIAGRRFFTCRGGTTATRRPHPAAPRPPDRRAARSDPVNAQLGQAGHESGQPGPAVADGVAPQHRAGGVDDADRVVRAGPVHSSEHRPCRDGDGGGIVHSCLLAVAAAGKHPVVSGRARRSLTDRRSRRSALSPVGTSRATGSCRTQAGCDLQQAAQAVIRWRPGVRQRPSQSVTDPSRSSSSGVPVAAAVRG